MAARNFSMLCNLVGAIVNTILDPLFIFVFPWAWQGAALATITGQILSFALVVFYLRGFKNAAAFSFRSEAKK